MKIFIVKYLGLWISILCALVFLFPTLQNDLLFWDDFGYVTNNSLIKDISLSKVLEVFKTFSVESNYHPITLLSLSFDYRIGGLDPFVYHCHNLLLHLANLLLVYVLFLRISKKTLIATIVTLLFCLHPMHVESVAWISSRKDLVYSLYFLLALIFYHASSNSKSNNQVYYWVCFIMFFMSLLSKGMAVTLPLILLALDYLGKRTDYKKMIFEKAPFFLLMFVFLYIGIVAQSEGGAINSDSEIPYLFRPFIASYGLIMYCLKAFMPINLSAFYPYPTISELPLYIYLSIIPVVGMLIYLFIHHRKKRILVFSSLFFLISIFPVIQIIPFGRAIMADRYTYLPYLGIFFLVAYSLEKIINKSNLKPIFRQGILLSLCGYFILIGALTNCRSKIWRNDNLLWSNVLEHYPSNYFALGNLGDYWFTKGDNIKALDYYNRTIEIEGRYVTAYNNRGLIHQSNGDTVLAMSDFNNAISLNRYPKAYINKGVLLYQQRKSLKAIKAYKKGIQLNKDYSVAYFNLGSAYKQIGEIGLALASFKKAENLGYQHPYLYFLQANLYSLILDEKAAMSALNKCIDLYPNNENALIEIGKQNIKMGQFDLALLRLNKSINLYPEGKHGEAYFLRSLIYLQSNQLEKFKVDSLKARERGYNDH